MTLAFLKNLITVLILLQKDFSHAMIIIKAKPTSSGVLNTLGMLVSQQ